jgi:hypothetical protein
MHSTYTALLAAEQVEVHVCEERLSVQVQRVDGDGAAVAVCAGIAGAGAEVGGEEKALLGLSGEQTAHERLRFQTDHLSLRGEVLDVAIARHCQNT